MLNKLLMIIIRKQYYKLIKEIRKWRDQLLAGKKKLVFQFPFIKNWKMNNSYYNKKTIIELKTGETIIMETQDPVIIGKTLYKWFQNNILRG